MQNRTPSAEAMELVGLFQRTINYPRDENGVDILAIALEEAAQKTKSTMREIADVCRERSQYCPTDNDLLSAGRELRWRTLDAQRDREQHEERDEWRRVYGRPQPMKPVTVVPASDFEPECQRFTRLCIAAYGEIPKDIYQRYAAMEALGFPLTREILSWYGRENIAAASLRLPPRKEPVR